MKKTIDLNADMGEGFGPWRIGEGLDARIMTLISAANVATGFHAGDPLTMHEAVLSAKREGVVVGAHPGFRDLVGFGRRHIQASAQELTLDVLYQIGALREIAAREGLPLHHVKLHGALYMHAARDRAFSEALVEALRTTAPDLPIYCMQPSLLWEVACEAGQPVVREFFADRDYNRDGQIVFIRRTDSLAPDDIARKVLRACQEGTVETVDGETIDIEFDSICLHSDTPGAWTLLEAMHDALSEAGIAIRAPQIGTAM